MPETIPTKFDSLAPLFAKLAQDSTVRLEPGGLVPQGVSFIQPEQILLRVGEAAEWLRRGAPGRALEVLETILAERESAKGPL